MTCGRRLRAALTTANGQQQQQQQQLVSRLVISAAKIAGEIFPTAKNYQTVRIETFGAISLPYLYLRRQDIGTEGGVVCERVATPLPQSAHSYVNAILLKKCERVEKPTGQ